ncbi:MAG TPA: carbon monoxide dehydrogenase [Actinobacteria bacterium]|nr:carbon monoxide dehydrogenase [Actinomycetota bacterium]
MAFTIAVAGKGGTGKTTMSGLIIKYLLGRKLTPVLAVDADANSNLNEVLGVRVKDSIGSLREEITKNVGSIPPGMSKDAYLELKIQEVLIEAAGFDLLVMGRPEGPGCYCYVNNILRRYMDILAKNYRYVIMDNEAGMEHLSRRTTYEVDQLLLVSDTSPRGIWAAARIRDLAKDLELKVKETYLIVNRVPDGELNPILRDEIEKLDLKLLGVVPLDEQILEIDLRRGPIFELFDESIAFKTVSELINKLNL